MIDKIKKIKSLRHPFKSGFIFAPYVMAESISVISEGFFQPKMALKSRYATVTLGGANYFGITI